MMRTVVFTQRVEVVERYDERRDCADQRIAAFLSECGCMPVPIPNAPRYAREYIDALNPRGIVLTGGNDLAAYGGNAPERDETERALLQMAVQADIPLLGFCRGMQFIAHYFGGRLTKIAGHAATRHKITGAFEREVNSYHNYGVADLPPELTATAWSGDGSIEALRHVGKPIAGIMWHPERESPFDVSDAALVKQLFFDKGGAI